MIAKEGGLRREFIGDALDHWKGSLIRFLESESLLENLAVVPMITDDLPWGDADISLYSRLLNAIGNKRILLSVKSFSGERRNYFTAVRHTGDLFLDPDTGIATGAANRQHVEAADLKLLADLDERRRRLLIIYQHASREDFRKRVKVIAGHVLNQVNRIHCTTYEGRQVAMLFFLYSGQRITEVNRAFQRFLGESFSFRSRLFIKSE